MADTKFVIGGETFMVPPLNLKAQRVAMRANTGKDATVDDMIGGYLDILAARLSSTATPLTAEEIEERLTGRAEVEAFNASMIKLMKASGFESSGEPKPAAKVKPSATLTT
jgi:hypothetical protein